MYTVMNDTIAHHAFKELMRKSNMNEKDVRDFVQTLIDVGLYAHAGRNMELPPIKMRQSGIIGAVKNAYHNWQDKRKEMHTRSLMGRSNTPPDPNLPKTAIL